MNTVTNSRKVTSPAGRTVRTTTRRRYVVLWDDEQADVVRVVKRSDRVGVLRDWLRRATFSTHDLAIVDTADDTILWKGAK